MFPQKVTVTLFNVLFPCIFLNQRRNW